MNENPNKPIFDLEERTFLFAKNIRTWVKTLPVTISNIEDVKQLICASCSVGANYIEANESLSKKDFVFRIKICRKEAMESGFWIQLILESNENIQKEKPEDYYYRNQSNLKKYFHQW